MQIKKLDHKSFDSTTWTPKSDINNTFKIRFESQEHEEHEEHEEHDNQTSISICYRTLNSTYYIWNWPEKHTLHDGNIKINNPSRLQKFIIWIYLKSNLIKIIEIQNFTPHEIWWEIKKLYSKIFDSTIRALESDSGNTFKFVFDSQEHEEHGSKIFIILII